MSIALFTPAVLARISLSGKAIELLGGCYLAYDLLDGRNGPLRSIARATGYLPLFLLGYAMLLGVPFALAASAGMAVLLAIEFHFVVAPPEPSTKPAGKGRSHKNEKSPSKTTGRIVLVLGFLRGLTLGAASMTLFSPLYGVLFGTIAGIGLLIGNRVGLAPSDDYENRARPGFRAHNILASAYRATAVAGAATIAGESLTVGDALWWALRLGLTAGIVSSLVGVFSPTIERWILNAPQRRLGLIGLGLLLFGTVIDAAPDITAALGSR